MFRTCYTGALTAAVLQVAIINDSANDFTTPWLTPADLGVVPPVQEDDWEVSQHTRIGACIPSENVQHLLDVLHAREAALAATIAQ